MLPINVLSRLSCARRSRVANAAGDDVPLLGLLVANVRAALLVASADVQKDMARIGGTEAAVLSVSWWMVMG